MSEYIAKCNEVVGISGKTLIVPDYIDTSKEIVRCRDCKHFTPKGTHKFENGKTNADYCTYVRGWMLQITPDGFCAWAKRKEGGDE